MEGGKKDGKGGVAGKGRRGEKRHGEGRKCIDSGRCTRETVCLIECKYVQVRRSGELYMPGRGIGVGASFTEQPAFTITSHTRPFTIVSSPPLTFPFSTAEPHGPRLLFISNSDASFASLFLSLSLSLSLSLFLFLASFLCHCTFLCRQSVTRIPLVPPFSPPPMSFHISTAHYERSSISRSTCSSIANRCHSTERDTFSTATLIPTE